MATHTVSKQDTLERIRYFFSLTCFLSLNQISIGKYLNHVFMHLLDVCYFSYKMRIVVLDYFITSLCFLLVVPFYLVYSKFMHKVIKKHNFVVLANPVVIQEAPYFDQEVRAAVVYLEMSFSCAPSLLR